jgi:prepilin peptidase CpaA
VKGLGSVFEYPLLFVFPLAMAYAAASDLLTMTIPNRVSLVLIAAFLALAPLAGLGWPAFWQHLAVGGAVLVVGIVMFGLRIFGGGDAKLLAVASLWLGLDHLGLFLGYTAILGGVLCTVVLLYRHLVPATVLPLPDWALRLHSPKSGVPYGVAIGGAALLVYPKTPWYLAFVS